MFDTPLSHPPPPPHLMSPHSTSLPLKVVLGRLVYAAPHTQPLIAMERNSNNSVYSGHCLALVVGWDLGCKHR